MRTVGHSLPRFSQRGFSEFEFLGLIAAGLLIAGLLAHFIIDQSIQVERLNALVHRDGVRLRLESRLSDLNVLKNSTYLNCKLSAPRSKQR